jgi:hypothetical protein
MTNILSRGHPRWGEFVERLRGSEGCDIKFEDEKTSWKCSHGRDRPIATAILRSIRNIDVEGTLDHLQSEGGRCDCEILFNCTV